MYRKLLALLMLWNAASAAQSAAILINWVPPSAGSGRGSIQLNLDNYTARIRYGERSTAGSLASNFGGVLSLDPASPVWAKGMADGSILVKARSQSITNASWSATPDSGSSSPSNWASVSISTTAIQQPTGLTATTLSLVCNPNPVSNDRTSDCSARLSPIVIGSVTFRLLGQALSIPLDGNGQAVLRGQFQGASPNNYTVSANYGGDATHRASASTANVRVNAPPAPPLCATAPTNLD